MIEINGEGKKYSPSRAIPFLPKVLKIVKFDSSCKGSGFPELKNRITVYDVINRVKSNCDVIANFS